MRVRAPIGEQPARAMTQQLDSNEAAAHPTAGAARPLAVRRLTPPGRHEMTYSWATGSSARHNRQEGRRLPAVVLLVILLATREEARNERDEGAKEEDVENEGEEREATDRRADDDGAAAKAEW